MCFLGARQEGGVSRRVGCRRMQRKLCHQNLELLEQREGEGPAKHTGRVLSFVQSADGVWSALRSSTGAFPSSIPSSDRVLSPARGSSAPPGR